MDKDSKGQRGGGLLPAVEGHSLQQNRIEKSGKRQVSHIKGVEKAEF